MAKAELGALLGNLPLEASAPPPPTRQAPAQAPAAERVRDSTDVDAAPLHLTLIRKDTRIREDQLEALTTHARRLNRAKSGGARITENTLVRIAIDLLLDRVDRATGSDESALLESLR